MWTVIAQMDPDDMMRWNHDGTGTHWWFVVGLVLVLLLIGLVVALLVRTGAAPEHPVAPQRSAAEELLAERLARGEIDPDEYRERLTALRGG
jgi:putative membrane protein